MKRLAPRVALFPSLFACVALAALAAGCATTGDKKKEVPRTDAEMKLDQGLQAMKDKNYEEARAYFDSIIGHYPFLDIARTAELKIADIAWDKEEWAEARDRYQQFVKLHPTNPEVDYAAFRAAGTHYQEIQKDFFMLPPSYEKDQTPAKNALRAMDDFIRQYSSSNHLEEAKKLRADIRVRLCQHELYVADFYEKRDKWPAVVNRLNNVVERYPGAGFDEKAYFGMHRAYLKMKDEARAKDTLKRIIAAMPGTKAAEKAQKLLGG